MARSKSKKNKKTKKPKGRLLLFGRHHSVDNSFFTEDEDGLYLKCSECYKEYKANIKDKNQLENVLQNSKMYCPFCNTRPKQKNKK